MKIDKITLINYFELSDIGRQMLPVFEEYCDGYTSSGYIYKLKKYDKEITLRSSFIWLEFTNNSFMYVPLSALPTLSVLDGVDILKLCPIKLVNRLQIKDLNKSHNMNDKVEYENIITADFDSNKIDIRDYGEVYKLLDLYKTKKFNIMRSSF